MSQIIYLIGPLATVAEVQRCIDSYKIKDKKTKAPELILFIDAAVQLRDQLNFSCAHYSLGDADGEGDYCSLFDEVHPTHKDKSDLALALNFIEKKISPAAEVHAYGLWGGRFDHQLANMGELLDLSQRHPQVKISWHGENKGETAFIVCGENHFDHNGLFSVFTLQENEVSIKGQIEYPLSGHSLAPLSSLGLSNVASGAFSIQARNPYLVIFLN